MKECNGHYEGLASLMKIIENSEKSLSNLAECWTIYVLYLKRFDESWLLTLGGATTCVLVKQ